MVRYALVPGGKIDQKRVAPGAVGFQRDLYTFPLFDEGKAQALELGLFSALDNYAATALDRMVRGDIPQEDEWRTAFAAFALSLQQRTPHGIESAIRDVEKEVGSEFSALPAYEDGLRLVALMRLFSVMDDSSVGRALINMEWKLIETSVSGVSLLTGDTPLLLYGGTSTPTGNLGIPVSDLESFAIPISPRKLLVGRWAARAPITLETMSPNSAAKAFNKYVVQASNSIVISADESHSDFIRKYLGRNITK